MIIYGTWEIWLIQTLQNSDGWIKPFMEMFTWAGYPQAYMAIVAIIYWSFDRKLGLRMAIFLPITASLNSILKQGFHAPRPFWVDQSIIAMHPENGFGMPSGHAQSVTVWLLAGAYLRKKWFWIIALVMTLGVGISRPYLGVHFPSQVILGWLIGIAVIICFIRFESGVLNWLNKHKFSHQLLIVLGCSVLMFLLGSLFVLLLNTWSMPADWESNASLYLSLDKVGLKSYGLASVAGNTGSFLGVTMGALLMSRKEVFDAGGIWWIRLLRSFIGLVCLILLYSGLQVISPDKSMNFLYAGWRFLGFYLIALSAVFLIPQLFIRLNLLKNNPVV
jgi:membrane-associated phospholipid phosphatase